MIQEIARKGYYEERRSIDECDIQVMFQRTRDFIKDSGITIITAKARPVQKSEVRQNIPRIVDYIGML